MGGGFTLQAYAQGRRSVANLGETVGDVGRVGHGEEAGDGTRRRLFAKTNLQLGMENELGLELCTEVEMGPGVWMPSGGGEWSLIQAVLTAGGLSTWLLE